MTLLTVIFLGIYCQTIMANRIINELYIYDDLITKESKKYGVDPQLIYSIIKIESNYNDRAVSSAGAQGLMQLMPQTAKRFSVTDSFDSEQNIKAGIEYIAFLIDRYQDVNYALAAYNAGENAVDNYMGIPPYKETQNYVKKISREYKKLTGLTIPEPGIFFARIK